MVCPFCFVRMDTSETKYVGNVLQCPKCNFIGREYEIENFKNLYEVYKQRASSEGHTTAKKKKQMEKKTPHKASKKEVGGRLWGEWK